MLSLRTRIPSWAGVTGFQQDEMLYLRLVLPKDFRSVKNFRDPFWSDTVRLDRRYLRNNGLFYMWNNLEFLYLNSGSIKTRFVPLTHLWSYFEVAINFWSQIGTLLAYIWSWLPGSPSYGWWVAVIISFAVNVAAIFVWEAVETWQFWWFPTFLVYFLERLNFRIPLGYCSVFLLRDFLRIWS